MMIVISYHDNDNYTNSNDDNTNDKYQNDSTNIKIKDNNKKQK